MIIAENGETITVTGFYFDNDMGGTVIDGGFSARVKIDRQFYDYECGQRFVGHLVDAKDVAKVKKAGTTGYAGKVPLGKGWSPDKVYFDESQIASGA